MEPNANQVTFFKRLSEILRSGKIIDLISQTSDYTFMFVSIPIMGSITITLLTYLKNGLFSTEISLISSFFTILFLLVGYYLSKEKARRGPSKRLTYDDWSIEIFLKSLKYIFYFLYSASLTALVVTFFEKQFGSEINRQITDLLPDVIQFYFFILFIILPIFVFLVSVGVTVILKTNLENSAGRRILSFIFISILLFGFGLFLETFDYTTIDVENASRIVSLLVGPLIIYIIRVLFFRKWINFDR
ncbi:MAG TPA: hypothetical protein PK863_00005 [Candidatus Dojkabacteria bacterium]|nr:hypothetical protein [Candidatus Dojkabacteria bacterium]HRP51154.1 hypothetical protein [Candidatus Dojkabacteria bacterium]